MSPQQSTSPSELPYCTLLAILVALLAAALLHLALADYHGLLAVGSTPDGLRLVSPEEGVWLTLGAGLTVAALFIPISQFLRGESLIGPIALGSTTTVTSVCLWALLPQATTGPQLDGSPIATGTVVSVITGIGMGYLSRLAIRRLTRDRSASTPQSMEAPQLAVPPGIRIAWWGRLRMPDTIRRVFALGMVFAIVISLSLSIASSIYTIGLLIALLTFGITSLFIGSRVSIDARGIRVSLQVGGFTWFHIPLKELSYAAAQPYPALNIIGYILPLRPNSRLSRVCSSPSLLVSRHRAPGLVMTVSDPEQAAATINTLIARKST